MRNGSHLRAKIQAGRQALAVAAAFACLFAPLSAARAACVDIISTGAMVTGTANETAGIAAGTLLIVEAIGAAQAGAGSAASGVALAERKAAEKDLEARNFAASMAAMRKHMAKNTHNTEKKDCRLLANNRARPVAEEHQRAVWDKLEDALANGTTGMATRVGTIAMQRLCLNGQLTPSDFGARWFVENGCFQDVNAAHAFLKSSTILDAITLLAPSPEQMTCLNNPNDPAACAAGTPAQVWTALNDKQRRYVSAVRYCELVAGTPKDTVISGDAINTMAGMSAAAKNIAAEQQKTAAISGCMKEIAYRTALDPLNPALAGDESIRPLAENGRRLARLIADINRDETDPAFLASPFRGDRFLEPGELKARNCPAPTTVAVPVGAGTQNVTNFGDCETDTPTTTYVGGPDANGGLGESAADRQQYYISPYVSNLMPMYYCLSPKTAVDIASGGGVSSEQTQNTLLCSQTVAMVEQQELERRVAFMDAIMGLAPLDQGSAAQKVAPAKVRYDRPDGEGGGLRHEAALTEPGAPPALVQR